MRKVTHSFEVHSNESACRKNWRLGLEQVLYIIVANGWYDCDTHASIKFMCHLVIGLNVRLKISWNVYLTSIISTSLNFSASLQILPATYVLTRWWNPITKLIAWVLGRMARPFTLSGQKLGIIELNLVFNWIHQVSFIY